VRVELKIPEGDAPQTRGLRRDEVGLVNRF